jgi:hypothetical protein
VKELSAGIFVGDSGHAIPCRDEDTWTNMVYIVRYERLVATNDMDTLLAPGNYLFELNAVIAQENFFHKHC